jgi:hypothetical protein
MEFQDSYSEKFKQLATELDIQTLSIEQIKSLTKYYQDNDQDYQKEQGIKNKSAVYLYVSLEDEIKSELLKKDRQISQLVQIMTMKSEAYYKIFKFI